MGKECEQCESEMRYIPFTHKWICMRCGFIIERDLKAEMRRANV